MLLSRVTQPNSRIHTHTHIQPHTNKYTHMNTQPIQPSDFNTLKYSYLPLSPQYTRLNEHTTNILM